MKRIIIYTMIGVVAFAAAGGSTMFLLGKADKNKHNQTQLPQDDFEETLPEDEPLTNQELFLNNVIDGHLNIQNLDLVVYNLEPAENLAVNFKGAFDYKGLDLAAGNFSEFNIQGNLNAKYKNIDETLGLTFVPGSYSKEEGFNGLTNGKVYFTYAEQNYSFEANTVLDVLDIIQVFGIPTQNIKAEPLTIDEKEDDSFNPMDILNQIKETETETGFDYSLSVPTVGTIVLESDKTNKLSGVRTEGKLSLNGIELSLDADIETGDNSFVTDPKESQSIDSIAGLFRSVAEIYQSKQIRSDFNIKFRNQDEASKIDLDLTGELGIDLSAIEGDFSSMKDTDFKNGKYALSILPVEGSSINSNTQVNTIKALYSASDIYLKVNELLKAKLTEQTITDIFDLVSQKSGQPDLSGAFKELNNLFVGTDIEALTKGDFSKIKNIVKNINITDTKYEFIFNPASFNLNGDELKIILGLGENDSLKSIEIEGLSYKTYFLDFKLNLKNYEVLDTFVGDIKTFKDYKGVLDIYNSISKLTESKKISTDYALTVIDTKNDKDYILTGDLSADLNGVDFNAAESFTNGKYSLNLATNIGEYTQEISATNITDKLYVNYNNLITNRVSHTTIVDAFNVIDNLMATTNPDGTTSKPSDSFNSLNSTLADIQTLINPIMDALKVGDLNALEKYIKIDETNLDADVLDLQIAPNGDRDYSLHLVINNVEKEISSIEIAGLKVQDIIINATLNLKAYEDITINEIEYAPLDNLVYGAFDLVERQNFNTSLKASIKDAVDETANPIILNANANIDIKNAEYYGDLGITAQLPIDKTPYNHKFKFDYSKDSSGLDSELLARYYSSNTESNSKGGMFINMHESKITSLISRIQNIPENNVIFRLLQIVKQAHVVLPIEEIINNKDYLSIFNKYLTNFEIQELQGEQNLNIKVAKELFGLDSELNVNISIKPETNTISNITIENLMMSGKAIDLSMTLDPMSEELKTNRLKVTNPKEGQKYFDFDNLDLLFELGINTTNTNIYNLKGSLNLAIPGIDLTNYNVSFKIEVLENGKVRGYVNVQSLYSFLFGAANTEIAILENDDAIIHYIYTNGFNTLKNHEIMKVTQEEMTKNLHYYLGYMMLNLPSAAFSKIDEAVNSQNTTNTSSPIKAEYESIFTRMEDIKDTIDPNKGKLVSTIDLSKLLDLGGSITAGSVNIDLSYSNGANNQRCINIIDIHGDNVVKFLASPVSVNFHLENQIITNPTEFYKDYKNIYDVYNFVETKGLVPGYGYTTRDDSGNYTRHNFFNLGKTYEWNLEATLKKLQQNYGA